MAIGGITDNSNAVSRGYRLTSASTDPSGLAVSERMKAERVGLATTVENAKDADGAIKVADSAFASISSILLRVRELSLRSMSGTMGESEKSFINNEIENLVAENDRIAMGTNFNGINLLDGSMDTMRTAVSTDGSGPEIKMFNATSEALGLGGDYYSLDDIDAAINFVSLMRGHMGASSNSLKYTIDRNSSAGIELESSISNITDADMAEEITKYKHNQVLRELGIIMTKKNMEQKQSTLNLFKTL